MPDLKKRDNFAIFLLQPIIFGLIQLLVTPVGFFGLQVKISANGYQKWCMVLLKLKSIDKKLKKRAQAKRCQQTGCLQIPNQLWLPVEHFIMMEGNPTQLNHSSSLFLVLFVCWSWSVRLGN